MVVAPVSGIVGDRQAQLGEYVQPGTRLMTVVPMDTVYVVANFKETQTARMLTGQHAEVRVDALPGLTFQGEVESLPPARDRNSHCCPMSPRAETSPASCSACRCGYAFFRIRAEWIACGRVCPRRCGSIFLEATRSSKNIGDTEHPRRGGASYKRYINVVFSQHN
jgi:hypothetical protein